MTRARIRTQKERQILPTFESVEPLLQPRPFAVQTKAATGQPEASLGKSQALGHSLTNLQLFPPSPVVDTPIVQKKKRRSQDGVPLQAKLTVGEPNDTYEQEADRTATTIVNQAEVPTETRSTPVTVQPLVEHQVSGGTQPRSRHLELAIEQKRGRGQPLPKDIQRPMERSFGADFSGVKVHTDNESDHLNRSIHSRAFTTQQDVFFKQGEYNPETREGKELLAHELTHVVQQNALIRKKHDHAGTDSIQRDAETVVQSQPDGETDEQEGRARSNAISLPAPGRARSNAIVSRPEGLPQSNITSQPTGRARSNALVPQGNAMRRELAAQNGEAQTVSSLADPIGDTSKDVGDNLGEWSEAYQNNPELAGAGGGFGLLSNLLAVRKNLIELGGAKDLTVKFKAGFAYMEAGYGVASNVATVVHSATGGETAEAVSKVQGIAGKGFGVLKGVMETIGKIKEFKDSLTSSSEKKFASGVQMAQTILETIKSGFEMAKQIMDIVGSTGEWLGSVLPGIDLAISGCKLIMSSYGMYKAIMSRKQMDIEKQVLKKKLAAQEATRHLFGRTFFTGVISSNMAQIARVMEEPGTPDPIKTDLKHYHFIHEMKNINRKRVNREILLISGEMLSVAGGIANLSGVGASVGLGLKASSAGVKGGSVLVRGAKQIYHDRSNNELRSSQAKHNRRIQHIEYIFEMIQKLPSDPQAAQPQINQINGYLQAAGVDPVDWLKSARTGREHPDALKAFKELYEAMKKRQFG
ncbi:MAG: DUF4157 domain-containing protein [Leptolyngbyaceae cyanobacterium bins.59]|nr:DUF4157 domain-containing protein [Leptolyngbyaceae cyanobacterium bins.59]